MLGKFFFAVFRRDGEESALQTGQKAATLARSAYLATYMHYDQRSMKTQRTPMMKRSARDVMGLSQAAFDRFWSEAIRMGHVEEKDGGVLTVPKEVFLRGSVKPKGYSVGYARIFSDQLRSLYRQAPATSHGYIGAILSPLPYLNIKYNVLCWDPFEKDLALVEPLTWTDLCRLTGRNEKSVTYLRAAYRDLCFIAADGASRRSCSPIRPNAEGALGREMIFIDPRVMFMGEDWRQTVYLMLNEDGLWPEM